MTKKKLHPNNVKKNPHAAPAAQTEKEEPTMSETTEATNTSEKPKLTPQQRDALRKTFLSFTEKREELEGKLDALKEEQSDVLGQMLDAIAPKKDFVINGERYTIITRDGRHFVKTYKERETEEF
jgi:hypothetical protein